MVMHTQKNNKFKTTFPCIPTHSLPTKHSHKNMKTLNHTFSHIVAHNSHTIDSESQQYKITSVPTLLSTKPYEWIRLVKWHGIHYNVVFRSMDIKSMPIIHPRCSIFHPYNIGTSRLFIYDIINNYICVHKI
jgi:hypothetical protein